MQSNKPQYQLFLNNLELSSKLNQQKQLLIQKEQALAELHRLTSDPCMLPAEAQQIQNMNSHFAQSVTQQSQQFEMFQAAINAERQNLFGYTASAYHASMLPDLGTALMATARYGKEMENSSQNLYALVAQRDAALLPQLQNLSQQLRQLQEVVKPHLDPKKLLDEKIKALELEISALKEQIKQTETQIDTITAAEAMNNLLGKKF